MKKPFDPTKPVQTRDGRQARILCTDLAGSQPIVAAVICEDGTEWLSTFNSDGFYYHNSLVETEDDLVNVPEETHEYINYYVTGGGMPHPDVASANGVGCGREALFKVTKVDGKVTKVGLVES